MTSNTSLDAGIPVSGTLRVSHSGVRWVVLGIVAWVVLSVPIGILVGKMLKRSAQGYPFPDDEDEEERDRWGFPVSRSNPVNPMPPCAGRCASGGRTKVS